MLNKTIPLIAAVAIGIAPAAQSENMFSGKAKPNSFWWPGMLDLDQLRSHDARSNPYGDDFDYARAFNSVDLKELKADVVELVQGAAHLFGFEALLEAQSSQVPAVSQKDAPLLGPDGVHELAVNQADVPLVLVDRHPLAIDPYDDAGVGLTKQRAIAVNPNTLATNAPVTVSDGTVELAQHLSDTYDNVSCVLLSERGRGRALRPRRVQHRPAR